MICGRLFFEEDLDSEEGYLATLEDRTRPRMDLKDRTRPRLDILHVKVCLRARA